MVDWRQVSLLGWSVKRCYCRTSC